MNGFNLGSLGDAIITNFVLSTGDDWSQIMFEYQECYGPVASLYFIVVVFFTQYVLLNLYVAVFLENFSLTDEEKRIKQVKKYIRVTMGNTDNTAESVASTTVAVSNMISQKNTLKRLKLDHVVGAIASGAKAVTQPAVAALDTLAKGTEMAAEGAMDAAKSPGSYSNSSPETIVDGLPTPLLSEPEASSPGGTARFTHPVMDEMVEQNEIEEGVDMALCVFPPDNAFRLLCIKISDNQTFINVIVCFILSAGAHLALEGPTNFKDAGYSPEFIVAMHSLDWFLFFAFWVECLMKCIAFGFVGTPETYLRSNKANILDFSVVMITTIDVILVKVFAVDAEWVRIFRLLRVFRLVRLLAILDGMTVILEALFHALPSVSAILALQGTAFVVFSILGINLFAGKYYRCVEDISLDRVDCEVQMLTWQRYEFNFDNIFESFCSLFVCQTLEGWARILRIGMDTDKIDMAPTPNENKYAAFGFFAGFMVINAFMLDKLFVGVLADFFAQESGSALMTADQKNWRFMELMVFHIIQKDRPPPAGNPMRLECYKIVQKGIFQKIINVFILFDVGSIILLNSGFIHDWLQVVFDIVNELALGLYTYEAIMKILAYGWRNYWVENKIAFLIVAVMWIMLVHMNMKAFLWFNRDFGYLDFIEGLQAVQILRLTRLLEASSNIRKLMKLIRLSLPMVLNLVIVMCLMLFIFGIMGMKLFGTATVGGFGLGQTSPVINVLDNFSNISNSMMLLFQISTGGTDITLIIEELKVKTGGSCFPFFAVFFIISNFILLNLFTALLLDNLDLMGSGDYSISDADIHHFKKRWNDFGLFVYDSIPIRQLEDFVISVGGSYSVVIIADPFWFNRLLLELESNPNEVIKGIGSFDFHQVLLALCHMRFNSNCLPYELELAAKQRAEEYEREHAARVIELYFRAHLEILNPPNEYKEGAMYKRWVAGVNTARLLVLTSRLKTSKVSSAEATSAAASHLQQAQIMIGSVERKKKPRMDLAIEGKDMDEDEQDVGLGELDADHIQALAAGDLAAHEALVARMEEMKLEESTIHGGLSTWCVGGRLVGQPFEVAQQTILVLILPIVFVMLMHTLSNIVGEERYDILSITFLVIVVFPALSFIGCLYIIASFFLHPGIFSVRQQMLVFSSWAGLLNYGAILFGLTNTGRGHCRLLAIVNQSAYFTQMAWQVMATYAAFRYIKRGKLRVVGKWRVIEHLFCWGAPTVLTVSLYLVAPGAFHESLDELNGIGWCGIRSAGKYRMVRVLFVFAPQLLAVNLYAYFYYYVNSICDPPKSTVMKRTVDETRMSTSNNEDLLYSSHQKRWMAMGQAANSIQLYMTAFMLSFLTNTMLTIILDRIRPEGTWTDLDYIITAAVVTPQQFLYARIYAHRKTGSGLLTDVATFHKATVKTRSGDAIANINSHAATWKWIRIMKADQLGEMAKVRLISNVRQTQTAWDKVQRESKQKIQAQKMKQAEKEQNKLSKFVSKLVSSTYFMVWRSAQVMLFIPVAVWVWVPMDFIIDNFITTKIEQKALRNVLAGLIFYGSFIMFPLFYFRRDANTNNNDRGLIEVSRFDVALTTYMVVIVLMCLVGAFKNRYNPSLLVVTGPTEHIRLTKKNVMGSFTIFIEFFQIAFLAFTAAQLLARYRPQDIGNNGPKTLWKFILGLILDNVFYVQYIGSLIAVGVWSMCYCVPAIATHIYTRRIGQLVNSKLGALFFLLSGPGFLTIVKSMMKPLFCLEDPLRYPDSPSRVLADRTLGCHSPDHLMMITLSLIGLCLFFPSATLTTAIQYGPQEDVRFVYLYLRLEFIAKGLMLFMSLQFTSQPQIALAWLMFGSVGVIAIIHFMQPCCLRAVNQWKQMVHLCQIWTCLTCQWVIYKDSHDWKGHLAMAVGGWMAIWAILGAKVMFRRHVDIFGQPPNDPVTVLMAARAIKQLENDIAHASSLRRWGSHARILELMRFGRHSNMQVRRFAFESFAILSYLDQMTKQNNFIELAADTIMPLLLDALHVEDDEDTKVFAVRTLSTFLQESRHILELTKYNDSHEHEVSEVIAELALAAERKSSKIDCMMCLLEMSSIDSNSLDAIAKFCVPMLAECPRPPGAVKRP
jgi:hypothetical protein